MKNWQYDELRVGYNLHFHTHNELTEHLVSLGLVGGFLFLIYLYFIFKESSKFSFAAKLGWLLFFKINSFWFLWTGTFTVFAVVVSCFITYDFFLIKKTKIFHNIKFNRLYLSFFTICDLEIVSIISFFFNVIFAILLLDNIFKLEIFA